MNMKHAAFSLLMTIATAERAYGHQVITQACPAYSHDSCKGCQYKITMRKYRVLDITKIVIKSVLFVVVSSKASE